MPEELTQYLKKLIREKGPVTFEEFMDKALYHEKWGYYAQRAILGREGDYYTSVHVSPLFGQMLARQMKEMWEQAGKPNTWHLVEFGPGEGYLAGIILETLYREAPEFYEILDYWFLEKSSHMVQKQKEILSGVAENKVNWVEDLQEIKEKPFYGCVLSNELVDALPVHVVQKSAGSLKELYVGEDREHLYFTPGEISTKELEDYFNMQGIELQEGQTAEVNLNALRWIREIARVLDKGFVITIDYGDEAEELYSECRFDGTLRCFTSHTLNTSPLQNPGEQDITASVNFTALKQAGENNGLKCAGLVSQSQFLINTGILEEVSKEEDFSGDPEKRKKTMALKQLIMPQGMGKVFKVLIQCKGFEEIPSLLGVKRLRDIF